MEPKIELNENFRKALQMMEGSEPIMFITGKAGTGKSTLLKYFRETTQKNVVILAPTGVAAVNVQGETIHSFFRFKPGVTLDEVGKAFYKDEKASLYRSVQTIIIDEISMVRADLLDCIDKFLRINRKALDIPFGGVQMIFMGDLFQLPPVVTRDEEVIFSSLYPSPYFFDAKIMQGVKIKVVELDKVYRQTDLDFIKVLNRIRTGEASFDDVNYLNERYVEEFEPDLADPHIYLFGTNAQADRLNSIRLQQLESSKSDFYANVDGDFNVSAAPAAEILQLKPGAQVMMLNNDSEGRWTNGTIGQIVEIFDDIDERLLVGLENGSLVEVTRYSWNLYKYRFDENEGKVISESVGSFEQLPVKLAWGITVHKSQGKTFDKVLLNLGFGAFAHGQLYVALSRCRTYEGLVLGRKLRISDVILDRRVTDWWNISRAI